MTDDARWLDGNALAGLLHDIFGAEITDTERTCQSCGVPSAVGAHRVYRGAGMVARCPACGDVALRITTLPDRHVVLLAGAWSLELPRG